MATPHTPTTFLSSEDWKTHLDQEGYVVIREVLTPEQKS